MSQARKKDLKWSKWSKPRNGQGSKLFNMSERCKGVEMVLWSKGVKGLKGCKGLKGLWGLHVLGV